MAEEITVTIDTAAEAVAAVVESAAEAVTATVYEGGLGSDLYWVPAPDFATLASLVSAGARKIRITGQILIASNYEIPSTVQVQVSDPGGYFQISTGAKLTFSGEPVAWPRKHHIFRGNAGGIPTVRQVEGNFSDAWRLPEWFGAVPDDIAVDSGPAIEAAAHAGVWRTVGTEQETANAVNVALANGYYYHGSPIDLRGWNGTLRGQRPGTSRLMALAAFTGTPIVTEDYPAGTLAQILIGGTTNAAAGTVSARSGSFDNVLETFGLDATAAAAAGVSIANILAPDWIQENSAIRQVYTQGANTYGMCFGRYSGANASNYGDVNGLVIEECQMGYMRQHPSILGFSVKFSAGRMARMHGCTVVGRYFLTAGGEAQLPISILTKCESLRITEGHLESGGQVVVVRDQVRPDGGALIGAGLCMENCDSLTRVNEVVRIESELARVNLRNISVIYNAAVAGPFSTSAQIPAIVNDVPRGKISAGIGLAGKWRSIVNYERAYQKGTHALNGTVYEAGGGYDSDQYLVTSAHPELQ